MIDMEFLQELLEKEWITEEEFETLRKLKSGYIIESIINKKEFIENRELLLYAWGMLPAELKEENILYYLEYLGLSDRIEIFQELSAKNKHLINADLRILNDDILNSLGKDRVNLIACYPDVTKKILEIASGDNGLQKINIISRCINLFMATNNTEEWTHIANNLINNISSFEKLIDSIKNVDLLDEEQIEQLTKLMIHDNLYQITNITQLEKLTEIKKKKHDELITSSNIEDKKQAVLLSKFGYTLEEAKSLLLRFGTDIDSIGNEDLKLHIKCLKVILDLDENAGQALEDIYTNCEAVKQENFFAIERSLKNEYAKLYNQGLLRVEDCEQIEANIYEAGTDFQIILTSLYPYSSDGRTVKNYYEAWNKKHISDTQHFCASYIRNDLISTVKIPYICYGFIDMPDDGLMFSGNVDIGSGAGDFVSHPAFERFLSPDNMIDSTESYNELDYRRIQNGTKKSPDYIVVFRKDGTIPNMEEAKRASEEFKEDSRFPDGLPIIIVDVDRCLEAERKKMEEMLKTFNQNPSLELAQQIMQKRRNNNITLKMNGPTRHGMRFFASPMEYIKKTNEYQKRNQQGFCGDLDLSQVEQFIRDNESQQMVSLEDLIENEQKVTNVDRKNIFDFFKKVVQITTKKKDDKRDDDSSEIE